MTYLGSRWCQHTTLFTNVDKSTCFWTFSLSVYLLQQMQYQRTLLKHFSECASCFAQMRWKTHWRLHYFLLSVNNTHIKHKTSFTSSVFKMPWSEQASSLNPVPVPRHSGPSTPLSTFPWRNSFIKGQGHSQLGIQNSELDRPLRKIDEKICRNSGINWIQPRYEHQQPNKQHGGSRQCFDNIEHYK